MVDVRITDNTYEQVKRAAQAQDVSIDDFIEEAVQLHLRNGALRLTVQQVAKVRAAKEDVKAGRVYTAEQAKAGLAEHRKEWLAARPD